MIGEEIVRRGDVPAVVVADTGESLSHAELDERSRRLATVLHDAGLRPGDVVALVSPPGRAAFEVFAAVRRTGLTFAALDHTLGLQELAYLVNDSGASALFVAAELEAAAEPLARLTPGVGLRVQIGGGVPGYIDYTACLRAAPSSSEDALESVHVHYSDGTTARPVAARLVRSNVTAEQLRSPVLTTLEPYHRVGADSVFFSTTSLADPVASQLYASVVILGGTIVTVSRPDARGVLSALSAHRATLAHFVPGTIDALLRLPARTRQVADLSRLAVLVHSSAPCPQRVKHALIDWLGPVVHEFYGGAEHEALTFITAEEWLRCPGSVGRGLRGPAQARDPGGAPVPPGAAGEVWFATDPHAVDWITLGDHGRVDEAGYVYLDGREDVEEAVRLHPGVADAALVGDPSGSRLTLVVQPGPGVAADQRLEREVVALLGAAQVNGPVDVEFVGKLPRTGSGRLVRRRLRTLYGGTPVSSTSVVPSARRPS